MSEKLFSARAPRKSHRRPKMSVFAVYGGVFALIVSVIAVGYQPPQPTSANSSVASAALRTPVATPDESKKLSVDELVATDIASSVAEQANLAIAANVANLSVSLAAKNELAQTSESSIVKPQIVQPTASSNEIIKYKVRKGDTASSIAKKFGVKTETVRWANNLATDSVKAGRTLSIPPVDGVIYTVKSGDTPSSVARAYNASEQRIISFNNLEISGLKPGAKIIVPSGSLPVELRPGYQAPVSSTTLSYGGQSGYRVNSGIRGVSAGNRYAWGNCTWYAYERRVQMGRPVGSFWGNANTWAYYAGQDGFAVSRTPTVGAILVDTAGYFGHVAVVESVSSNGDIVISEMNNAAYGGYGVVNRRTISAGQAAAYQYIR